MTMTTRQKALHALLRKIFTDVLPKHGFLPRGKQIELADEVLSAFRRLDIFLAESEVGTGKTLAYLLPAVLARRGRLNEGRIPTALPDGKQAPIVVATSSIALQRAIVREAIPALSEILLEHGIIKTPLTAALRKGKGNYLCDRRLAQFHSFADVKTKAVLAPLFAGAAVDLGAAKGLTPYMKRNVCVDSQCNQDCPRYSECRYMRHMRDVRRGGYDFQVLNHNLFLADLLRRSKGQQSLIPDYQGVIIDEGHKFLDAARDMYGAALSLDELYHVARDVRGFTFAPGVTTADISRECDRIQSKSRLLFQFLNKEGPPIHDDGAERYATKIRQRTENLMQALKENTDALSEMLTARPVGTQYEQRKREVLWMLNRISDSLAAFIRHGDLVYWMEEAAGSQEAEFHLTVLRGIPKNLGELLHRDLWGKDIPIILTSGTLSAAGSFEHIKKKAGIDLVPAKRLWETSKPSPFNHRENALIYISERTTFPDSQNQEYIAAIAEEIERLVRASHGHAAVLFTSHDALGRVYTALQSRGLPYPLFRMGRGEIAPVERFKASGNGVLFASGALWEGIDIPGDVLSMLIIVRLPFAVPDPVSEWERTLYAGMDEYKSKVIVPEMLVKLKQGFGRLIRNETDTGAVAILDSRANENGAYRRRVLAALPPCRATDDVGAVERFLREKKQPEYFEEAS